MGVGRRSARAPNAAREGRVRTPEPAAVAARPALPMMSCDIFIGRVIAEVLEFVMSTVVKFAFFSKG